MQKIFEKFQESYHLAHPVYVMTIDETKYVRREKPPLTTIMYIFVFPKHMFVFPL